MELRLVIAYLLMAVLVAGVLGTAAWLYHNSPSRKLGRRRERDEEMRQKRSMQIMAKDDQVDG